MFFNVILVLLMAASMSYIGIMQFPWKLRKKQSVSLIENGVVHYTFKENCDNIMKTRIIKPKNAKKHNWIYFFSNKNIPLNILLQSKIQERNVKVTLSNLTKEQVRMLKLRAYDNAIVHKGEFNILADNKVSIEDSDINMQSKLEYSVGFHLKHIFIYISLVTIFVSIVMLLCFTFK